MLFNTDDRALFRRVWQLAWPTAIYGALELTVGLVDLLMVRPLGPSATAAIGIGRQVTFLVEVSAMTISIGVITLVSQAIGAGATARVEAIVRQSYRLVLLFGLPATLLGVAMSRPLLVAMQAEQSTIDAGAPYLQIYFLGLIFLWANLIGTAIFRGAGNMHTPLKIALAVNVLNITLNYLFIYGIGSLPAFGVQGAAIGTVVARTCSAAMYLWLLHHGIDHVRLRWRVTTGDETDKTTQPIAKFDWALTGRMLRIGGPIAVSGVVRNGSRLFFLGVVGLSSAGVALHAAVGIGLQVRLLSIVPAVAFQIAIATLIGRAIGRGDLAEAETIGRRMVLLLSVPMLAVTGFVLVFAQPLAQLFVASTETARLGAVVLRWFAVAQFFSALSIITQGALVGAGDTAPTMRYTILCQWIVMLPLAYGLLVPLEFDPVGPLVAWTVAPILALTLMQRRFHSGRWKTIRA